MGNEIKVGKAYTYIPVFNFVGCDGDGDQVGLALVRALLYMARPGTCKLGNIPNSNLYRDVEQYPGTIGHAGILILQLGSPIYFANGTYIKERLTCYKINKCPICLNRYMYIYVRVVNYFIQFSVFYL